MAQALYFLGFVGAAIVAVGYLPQITHLVGKRCARGVSIRAWCLWSVASLLFFLYAVSSADWVIAAFATVQLAASITTTVLATRYQGRRCQLCREKDDVHRAEEGHF